jgi:hypothetical protein
MTTGTLRLFGTAIVMVGVTVGCSFGSTASGGQSNDSETSDVSTPAMAEPSATPEPDAGGDGVPAFTEGAWTGGEAEVRVSGSDPRTITGQILERSSLTTDRGSTILTYVGGPTGIDTINISFSNDDERFLVDAYVEEGFLDITIPFGQPGCEVTYQESSDNHIEGTFRCEGSEIHRANKPVEPVVLEGSFSATR